MKKTKKNSFSIYEWQDAYYDGFIDERKGIDEYTEKIIKTNFENLWGFDDVSKLEKKKYKEDYIE